LDWAISTLGVFYALHLATDVRRGRTSIQPYRYDPRYDYVRSADPVGFWILIAIQGALAAATIFGYLGDLLGLWHL
jgi:hypothetical protein